MTQLNEWQVGSQVEGRQGKAVQLTQEFPLKLL